MMTDPLMWSPISLGRWFGTQVRVHIFLIVFVVLELLNAALAPEDARFLRTAAWIGLLLLALALHELAHTAAAAWQGSEPEEVRLWPLGNMVGAPAASRTGENLVVLLAGPIANLTAVVASAVVLAAWDARFVWNPWVNRDDVAAPAL